MQLTIDSTEPLDRVLKVVSSLYGVEVAVVSTAGASTTPSATRSATSRRAQPAPGPRGGRPGRSAAGSVARKSVAGNGRSRRSPAADLGAVRSWAREKGFKVSDRGRVSNAVLKAYEEDRRSAS
jgi:hypothetical protein